MADKSSVPLSNIACHTYMYFLMCTSDRVISSSKLQLPYIEQWTMPGLYEPGFEKYRP